MEDLLIITPRWRWTSLDGSVVHTGPATYKDGQVHLTGKPTGDFTKGK